MNILQGFIAQQERGADDEMIDVKAPIELAEPTPPQHLDYRWITYTDSPATTFVTSNDVSCLTLPIVHCCY